VDTTARTAQRHLKAIASHAGAKAARHDRCKTDQREGGWLQSKRLSVAAGRWVAADQPGVPGVMRASRRKLIAQCWAAPSRLSK
jgi:hypothetical protein